jgi:ketosteroid isomerase-like protein
LSVRPFRLSNEIEEARMEVSIQPAVERVARVLAGQRISANADGEQESAGKQVDAIWRDYLDDAVAVMKTLREPDQAMAQAGDPRVWEAMILAGLEHAKPETVVL